MLEKGMILKFIPNMFASGVSNSSRRICYMLVAEIFEEYISLINVSKIEDKPNCFTYKYNVPFIDSIPPLFVPSFAKTNDRYLLEKFDDIESLIVCNGKKVDNNDFETIIEEYNNLDRAKIEQITLTKSDIYY